MFSFSEAYHDARSLERLFPPPTYEMPDDLWFEVTGVLQFLLALWAAYYLFRLWREERAT